MKDRQAQRTILRSKALLLQRTLAPKRTSSPTWPLLTTWANTATNVEVRSRREGSVIRPGLPPFVRARSASPIPTRGSLVGRLLAPTLDATVRKPRISAAAYRGERRATPARGGRLDREA